MLNWKNTCLVVLVLAVASCQDKPKKSLKALTYPKATEAPSAEQAPKPQMNSQEESPVLSPDEVEARLAALEKTQESQPPLKTVPPRLLSDGELLEMCQKGNIMACHRYGYRLSLQGNHPNAERFYSVACERGYMKSCNNLGWTLEKRGHLSQASNFYAQACLEKHPGACKNLKRANLKLRDTLLSR